LVRPMFVVVHDVLTQRRERMPFAVNQHVIRALPPSRADPPLRERVRSRRPRRRMSPLLEQIDRWLDDEAFFAPFQQHFNPMFGRPSIPMEVYLRMMFLKYQYRLGYESLRREVGDSISWRIFCRLNLDDTVPAPATLSKITTRCGEDAVLGLNEAPLARADAAKLVKTGKVRADTTVVSANVEYPTDSGLLAHAVTLIGKLVGRIKSAGGAPRTVFRDATEAAASKVRAIGAKLKLGTAEGKQEAQATVLRLTGELADLAERAITEAGPVLDNARRALARVVGRQRGRMHRAINKLSTVVIRAARVVTQGRRRVAGERIESATRLVSLHEPDARPIVKGRLGKPVGFGYKAQVVDNEDGLVLDYDGIEPVQDLADALGVRAEDRHELGSRHLLPVPAKNALSPNRFTAWRGANTASGQSRHTHGRAGQGTPFGPCSRP
jgi:transposase, IS5 family